MIGVLALGLAERVINGTLGCDPMSQTQLAPLSGKSLRVIIDEPSLSLDVLFCDDHLRFEPVSQSLFEPQGGVVCQPDCTLHVATPQQLLALMQDPTGNLPIKGDYKVLMQIKALAENFRPELLNLETLIGKNAGSYAYLVSQELSPVISPVLSSVKSLFMDALAPPKAHPLDDAISQKKQELLRLTADIEREKARLAALQNQPT